MIKKIDDLNFYELLEISPKATIQDVQRAYERVRRVYDPNSIALYSLFTSEETAQIRQRIEEAYRTLAHEENRREYDRMLRDRHEIPEPEPPAPRPRPCVVAPPQPTRPVAPVQTAPREERREPAPAAPTAVAVTEFSGPTIRLLREQAGLSIRDIADITKISSRFIEYLECEEYAKLPVRTYIRGFLLQYAKALGCDPERFVGDYLKRHDTAAGK